MQSDGKWWCMVGSVRGRRGGGGGVVVGVFFFFQAEDGIRDRDG